MDGPHRENLRAWLEAERDDVPEADLHFRALFAAAVPRLEAPPSLVPRLVGAIPVPGPSCGSRLVWAWLTVTAALALAGLTTVAWNPVGTLRGIAAGLSAVKAVAHWAASLGGAWLDTGTAAWHVAAVVGRASTVLVASGQMPLVLLANILVAGAACYALTRLLAEAQEEWS